MSVVPESGKQLPELPRLSDISRNDLILVRDVSDLRDGFAGTDKHARIEDLRYFLNPKYHTITEILDSAGDVIVLMNTRQNLYLDVTMVTNGELRIVAPPEGYCDAILSIHGNATLSLVTDVNWLTPPIDLTPRITNIILQIFSIDGIIYLSATRLVGSAPVEITKGPFNLGSTNRIEINLDSYYEIVYTAELQPNTTLKITPVPTGCYTATLLLKNPYRVTVLSNVIWVGNIDNIYPEDDGYLMVKVMSIDGIIFITIVKQVQDVIRFAKVASTGEYADLLNKPVLSAVATSGSYADILNKPTLSTVGMSGDYRDLINRPVLGRCASANMLTLPFYRADGYPTRINIVPDLSWVRKTSNYVAVPSDRILADTSQGSFIISLPAIPRVGDIIYLSDGADWSVHNLIINRNGFTIENIAEDLIIDVTGFRVDMIYDGTTWQIITLESYV